MRKGEKSINQLIKRTARTYVQYLSHYLFVVTTSTTTASVPPSSSQETFPNIVQQLSSDVDGLKHQMEYGWYFNIVFEFSLLFLPCSVLSCLVCIFAVSVFIIGIVKICQFFCQKTGD